MTQRRARQHARRIWPLPFRQHHLQSHETRSMYARKRFGFAGRATGVAHPLNIVWSNFWRNQWRRSEAVSQFANVLGNRTCPERKQTQIGHLVLEFRSPLAKARRIEYQNFDLRVGDDM